MADVLSLAEIMPNQQLKAISTPKKHKKGTSYRKVRFKAWVPSDSNCLDTTVAPVHGQQQRSSSSYRSKSDSHIMHSAKGSPIETIETRYRCPSPLTKLPVNGIWQDPFIKLPIKATGCVPATLDYFITVVSPQELARTGNVDDSALDHHLTLLLPFMLQSACLFQSIIALCRSSILISLGQFPLDDIPVLHHRHLALTSLRENLKSDQWNSDANLLTIAMLLTLEYLSDNTHGVSAHLTGLKRLAATRADLDDITPWRSFVKRGLYAYESLGSFMAGKPPDIPPDYQGFITDAFAELSLDGELAYPAVPFEPDPYIILAKLPPGFSEVCLLGRISFQTMNVLVVVAAIGKRYEGEDLCKSRLAMEPHVMFSVLQRLSSRQLTSIENYITLGLMAWAFQLCNLKPLTLFHDPPLRTFVRLIPTHEVPESVQEQQCFCWISMAVAGALNLRSIRMPGAHLVLERLFAMYPLSRKWDTLESTLKSFFWNPTIGAHWKKCWLEGMERRAIIQARRLEPEISRGSLLDREADVTIDNIDELTLAGIAAHTRATPRSAFIYLDAAQCPFLNRRAAGS